MRSINEYLETCINNLHELVKWQNDNEPRRYSYGRRFLKDFVEKEIEEARQHLETERRRLLHLKTAHVIPFIAPFPASESTTFVQVYH
jgi:hypothetical protein